VRPEVITAVVLCGGTGSRLGHADKPLARVGGRMLVEHVIAALEPQVGQVIVSCGARAAPYEALGYVTAVDAHPGDGPLGGLASALPLVRTEWILVHPGDTPFVDRSLVARLTPAAEAGGAAVPRAGGYRQNLVLLLSRARARSLTDFYESGGRAVRRWLDHEHVESVDMNDIVASFFDVDTAADLAECERRLVTGPG
jgi:molybdenum cofactor guanylyltransferase